MSDSIGTAVKLTIFGESHGAAIGAVLDGVGAGLKIDEQFISAQMDKRRAKGAISTARTESDKIIFLSGVYNGYTTGTAICFVIENTNTKSGDYAALENLLRPGHADYTAQCKYKGFQDVRGGGHFSGRLTAPIVAAGAICLLALEKQGIKIGTHLLKCAGISDDDFAQEEYQIDLQLNALQNAHFSVLCEEKGEKMQEAIMAAAQNADSVGGVLETAIIGVKAGVGEPFFDSVESVISHLLFSMPAIKGVEFGKGFEFADMFGSKANDFFFIVDDSIMTATNNNAGINGGITNAMPIILRTAVKPTPSILQEQRTVNFKNLKNAKMTISGRHDPCIAHRGAIVQTSLCAIAIADLLALKDAKNWQEGV